MKAALILDDNPKNSEIFSRVLKKEFSFFEIKVAKNYKEFIDLLSADKLRYDLLVIDNFGIRSEGAGSNTIKAWSVVADSLMAYKGGSLFSGKRIIFSTRYEGPVDDITNMSTFLAGYAFAQCGTKDQTEESFRRAVISANAVI